MTSAIEMILVSILIACVAGVGVLLSAALWAYIQSYFDIAQKCDNDDNDSEQTETGKNN